HFALDRRCAIGGDRRRRHDCCDCSWPYPGIRPKRVRPPAPRATPSRLACRDAIYVGGAFISAYCLRNDDSVVQIKCDMVDYYHTELPTHLVLLAEDLPVKDYPN